MTYTSINSVLRLPNGIMFKHPDDPIYTYTLLDGVLYTTFKDITRVSTQDEVATVLYHRIMGGGFKILGEKNFNIYLTGYDPFEDPEGSQESVPVKISYTVTKPVTKTITFKNDKDAIAWIKLNKHPVTDIVYG